MGRVLTVVVTIAATVWMVAAATAREYKAGDRVVAIRKCPIILDGKIVDFAFTGWVYQVDSIEKDRLWVPAKTPGWIKQSEVIPLDEAIEYFTKEIEKNPADRALFRARALVFMALFRLDDAIDDFTALLRENTNDDTVWNDRGRAWMFKGDWEKAIADYDEAIRRRPWPIYLNNGCDKIDWRILRGLGKLCIGEVTDDGPSTRNSR